MLEEEMESNQVDEPTAQNSSTEETNDESSMSEEDASDENQAQTTEQSEEGTDEYKDELERVRSEYHEKLDKAEKKIVKLKQASKNPVDTASLAEEVWAKLDERIVEREVQTQARSYERYIDSVSKNKNEADLIKLHLKNSIKPTGDMEADVRRAKLLANEKKIMQTNRELAASLSRQSTVSTVPNFSGGKISNSSSDNFNAKERELIAWAKKASGKA